MGTERPRSADYGHPDWKHAVEAGDNYDYKRFQSTPKARRRHLGDQRLLLDYLRHLPPGQKILDAPSGMGRFLELMGQHGHHVVAAELNFGRVRDAHQRTGGRSPGLQADVFHLPCADGAFDVAVCFRLLHHLEAAQVQVVLQELRRVARRAFVTYNSKASVNYCRQRLEGKVPQRKYYSASQIEQWCREAGWRVEQFRPAFGFFKTLHAAWLV
jgi:SAM-dependent methyltransferase